MGHNEENLTPMRANTARAVEFARKGGKASGESRRRKKAIREAMEAALSAPVTGRVAESLAKDAPIDVGGLSITAADALAVRQLARAIAGDVRAAAFVRDTVGESPTLTAQVETVISPDIARATAELEAIAAEYEREHGL